MEKCIKICDKLSYAGGLISGGMMVIGIVLVLLEIVFRTFFSNTLYITEEYSGYLMAAMTFLGLAYTLRDKSHIRMVFLHTKVTGRARIILDLYAYIVGLIFSLMIVVSTSNFFWDSVVSQSRSMQISETYLAIPQFFLPLGAFLLALQFLAELLRTIIQLRSGVFDNDQTESSSLGR